MTHVTAVSRTLEAVLAATALLAAGALFTVAGPGNSGKAFGQETPLDIVRPPDDVPAPVTGRSPATIDVHLTAMEVLGTLDDGATYMFWTFDGKVPGPFLRVRVGDTVRVHLTNHESSMMTHNVDFHAATGPDGGGAATQSAPGETRSFTFRALHPGVYVYHGATMPVAQPVASGMYGLILVEPEGGLPRVDREFYVMQGELYAEQPIGTKGEAGDSFERLLNEQPTHFLFNGAVGGLKRHPLKAKVGETIRIYFGVGGPNFTSSFHVIGEVFDRVYGFGSLTTDPLEEVQTVPVAPGSAVALDMRLDYPGSYLLVDHALSRLEKGIGGVLEVEGPADPAIFDGGRRASTLN